MNEQAEGNFKVYLRRFVLISFCVGLLWNLLPGIGLWKSNWMNGEPGVYYRIANALQFWL